MVHDPSYNPESDSAHPFGGCERLLRQYQIVGQELERLASSLPRYGSAPKSDSLQIFRESLSFVPTEVLDSYREDLLDPEIFSERLFISPDHKEWRLPLLSFSGMIGAIVLGLNAASSGASFFLSFSVTLFIAAPFAAIWHFAPRDGTLKRLRFAQWLAEEINRRNGVDEGGARRRKTTSILSPLWAQRGQGQVGGAFSHSSSLLAASEGPSTRSQGSYRLQ